MGASCARYFKNQFQLSKLKLEHDDPSDFYVSCWQRSLSPLPLLFIRAIVFVGCLALTLTSDIMHDPYWYMLFTYWGVFMITLTSGLAFCVSCVSCMAYCVPCMDRSNESSSKLPVYAKIYWVFHNVSIPLAFFITVYYLYLVVHHLNELDEPLSPYARIHSFNSVLMLLLLVTSRVPSQPLHVYQPICFILIYNIFTIIYYYAGHQFKPRSVRLIDDVSLTVDWDTWDDVLAILVMIIRSGLAIIVVHLIVVVIAVIRDTLTRLYCKTVPISDNSMSLV